jgi:glutamine amidotransferase
MNIAVIKYNAGNVQSVLNALERLGVTATVTNDPEELKAADKVIFPGVGEARSAMNFLQSSGIDHIIKQLKQPFLGICLGMQLLCEHSEENDIPCLGIFPLKVKKFTGEKVPQMGWNTVEESVEPLYNGFDKQPYFYFVHSYYAELGKETASVTEYGVKFSSALQKDNFYGVQFHAEKSGKDGEQLIKNFLDL